MVEEIFKGKKVTNSHKKLQTTQQSIHAFVKIKSKFFDQPKLGFYCSQSTRQSDMSDIADILALSLEIDNEDPLPKNPPNVGTINNHAKPFGRWICQIVCPWVQEANSWNLNGWFSKMNWKIIAEADELELFKVSTIVVLIMLFKKIIANNSWIICSCAFLLSF